MIQCVIALVLLIAVPSPASAQPLAQIVEAAKAEKELLTYATTQAPVMNRLVQGFNKYIRSSKSSTIAPARKGSPSVSTPRLPRGAMLSMSST